MTIAERNHSLDRERAVESLSVNAVWKNNILNDLSVLKVMVWSSIMFYYYKIHVIVITYTQLFDLLSLIYYLSTMIMIY